ncbi:SRPBCC family protein [Maribellus maritimus]|uniref:SRPBCC family protein n=1 Tax=Maribellus maritimus TaxID=2870838 RepID=UPI001EECEC88|nr:SRPBCC family protein [Maribellus maritimus]MCG6186164.1 SRPBCC domain-containing protein [Maribellus maritimus]
MQKKEKTFITVSTKIEAPVQKVWDFWTQPNHIINWNFASDDWFCPWAKNDIREGGKFVWRMEAKDGSFGFDFSGTYNFVKEKEQIEETLDDERKVKITFRGEGDETHVKEVFEAENENPIEMQKKGWQAILNNFKKYVEASGTMENIHFEILIDAKPEKVYKIMLAHKTYREWTKIFNPTSHYKGSWEKESKILFIGIDENGNEGGMVSRIKENIPNQFVSIEHLGLLENGVEKTSGPEVEPWSGGLENYTFTDQNGKTLLKVDMITKTKLDENMSSYFTETWPKALEKLKTICEQ